MRHDVWRLGAPGWGWPRKWKGDALSAVFPASGCERKEKDMGGLFVWIMIMVSVIAGVFGLESLFPGLFL